MNCCDDNGQLTSQSFTNPKCAPILIPREDPVHRPLGTQCLNFVRTGTTRDRGCTPLNAPAQPVSNYEFRSQQAVLITLIITKFWKCSYGDFNGL